MPTSKWSDDEFLNRLRGLGDDSADGCLRKLDESGHSSDFARVFKNLNSNDEPLPDDLPAPLQEFFAGGRVLPAVDGAPVDMARIARGQKVFLTHAFPSALVLLAKSLPAGYSAPNLSTILSMSDELAKNPYKRVLGVLQMLINVASPGSLDGSGKAIVTAQKLRLLHAGIRRLVATHLPDYQSRYQVPVNLEDMLGTIMGFSLLLLDGLRRLGIALSEDDAEDYYYLWRVFAQSMGVHPLGQPNSTEYVPANLAEAREFYESYARRHYTNATENPEGVKLARAILDLLNRMLPQTPLRRLGLRIVPRVYMEELLGDEAMARVALRPVRFLAVTKWLISCLPRIWMWFWDEADKLDASGTVHENLSRILFQRLITESYGGEVTFFIPQDLADLRRLA